MLWFNTFFTRNVLKKSPTTTAGFEPARAKPNGFQVHLLNHSDMLSHILDIFFFITFNESVLSFNIYFYTFFKKYISFI